MLDSDLSQNFFLRAEIGKWQQQNLAMKLVNISFLHRVRLEMDSDT